MKLLVGSSQCNNYHCQQAKNVQHRALYKLTLLRVWVFTVQRVRNSIDSPARSKWWLSMKRWDQLTHYDVDLNKLSSSCLLWQQTSARLYGARQQATD